MAKPRSLPLHQWPGADQREWELVCAPGLRLKRGGRASHLRAISRDDLARRYGYFLDHLDRTGRLDRAALPATQVTSENVESFLVELRGRVSSVTQYGSIGKLGRAAELLAPDLELSWLREIEKDLEFLMQPRSKHDRLVLTQVLVEAICSARREARPLRSTPAITLT
jgi:hypothetical protein